MATTTSQGHSDPVFFDTTIPPSSNDSAYRGQEIATTGEGVGVASLSQPHVPSHTLTYPTSDPEPTISVALTNDPLSILTASRFVASPTSGANIFFTGTTRNTFGTRTVTRLEYSAYPALALKTMLTLCQTVQTKHRLDKVYLVHRLGVVAVGEESIVIGVSSPHRQAAWEGGQELLELVKAKVEVWKREWFLDGEVVEGRDGAAGVPSNSTSTSTSASAMTAGQAGTERGEWRANAATDSQGNPVAK